MDATAVARDLLTPVPAHETTGLSVIFACDGVGVVAMDAPPSLSNVIGSLHSSGLITLIDAAGLAAIIAVHPDIIPLGSAATLRFLAPARGRLTATCSLGTHARDQLAALAAQATDKIKIKTTADVRDEHGALVCQGTFDWSVRSSSVS
ncbi:PaaI family thioesterase [Actinoplanes sp. NPDC051513]|uniref:PaaI family thioesterase n=1 Tax=Actinoplanes sp. NPDC051513 TaxID=3363908 RepID=UPI0037B79620